VDLTCSFIVVDVRRHDSPIVYCSPSFCNLTGYTEPEVLGRNCRFLQSPGGVVPRGSTRKDTSQTSVAHLRKALSADKECQASLMNYRKDGSAFLNLVTAIPIAGGVAGESPDEVVFHVGFQVDLTEQPNIILQKLRDGTYVADYPVRPRNKLSAPAVQPSGKKVSMTATALIPAPRMSSSLQKLVANPRFIASLPLASATTVPAPLSATAASPNHPLSLILLNHAPDFTHVVSLKGSFLYVAPSVTRVLGYDPAELVGRSLADLAHPEDVVPLERELKESSALPGPAAATEDTPAYTTAVHSGPPRMQVAPRTVDILFRARTKGGRYVWLECRGRLHVEPGKGRKAIVLSGRARAMGRVRWDELTSMRGEGAGFWGLVGGGAVLGVGEAVGTLLGWVPDDLVGRRVGWLVDERDREGVEGVFEELDGLEESEETEKRVRKCWLRCSSGGSVLVELTVHRPARDAETGPVGEPEGEQAKKGKGKSMEPLVIKDGSASTALPPGVSPAPLIMHVRVLDDEGGAFTPSAFVNLGSPGYTYPGAGPFGYGEEYAFGYPFKVCVVFRRGRARVLIVCVCFLDSGCGWERPGCAGPGPPADVECVQGARDGPVVELAV
jgi:PAS domain-containing protein